MIYYKKAENGKKGLSSSTLYNIKIKSTRLFILCAYDII